LALLAVEGVAVWIALALVGVCAVGWNGVFHAFLAESAPVGEIARTSAVAFVFVYGGSIAVPPLLGLVADDGAAWTTTWLLAAAVTAALALTLGALALHAVRTRVPPTSTNT